MKFRWCNFGERSRRECESGERTFDESVLGLANTVESDDGSGEERPHRSHDLQSHNHSYSIVSYHKKESKSVPVVCDDKVEASEPEWATCEDQRMPL